MLRNISCYEKDRANLTLLIVGQTPLVQKFPGPIGIPDVDVLVGEGFAVGAAPDKPQELLRQSPPEDAFCGQKRELPCRWSNQAQDLSSINSHETQISFIPWQGFGDRQYRK